MEEARRPARALAHPLWWVALLLLVVNDHLLKAAGWLPGAVTGKLSDVAGLLVAPALLAALLGLRTRRALGLAHAAVGAGFAAINLWPAAARALEAATAVTPFPWQVTVDPTDLLALPALLLSWTVLVPAMGRPVALRRPLSVGTALAGAVACLGTSPPPDPVYPSWRADLVVGNATDRTLVLRLRPLKDSVRLDCAAVAAAPNRVLRPELFGPAAVTWEVQPDRTVPARGTGEEAALEQAECFAYLLEGGGLPRTLLFWRAVDYPVTNLSSLVSQASAANLVVLRASGAAVVPDAHPAAFVPAFVATESPTEPPCRVPDATGGGDWSEPLLLGTFELVAVERGADGCFLLDLVVADSGSPRRTYVCAPLGGLPFEPGERLRIARLERGAGGGAITGLELTGGATRLRLGRGADLVPFVDGGAATLRAVRGCGVTLDACGDWLIPLSAAVQDAGGRRLSDLDAGGSVDVGGGRLTLLRAFDLAVADSDCLPLAEDLERVVESLWVGPVAGSEEPPPAEDGEEDAR